MTITLHLGVNDIPYVNDDKFTEKKPTKPGKKKKIRGLSGWDPTGAKGVTTTGEVADILEAKYGVMEMFFEEYAPKLADNLAEAMVGTLETMIMGGPSPDNPFAEGEAEIETDFKHALDAKFMDGLAAGVPTKAALKGVNHRLKIKKGNPRPSFIDTGLYQANFRAWIEVKD